MAFYIYVLKCEAERAQQTYVGWTTDLERRLAQHNAGVGAKFTRGRKRNLIYAERHLTRREAMSREWRLKRDRPFRKQLQLG